MEIFLAPDPSAPASEIERKAMAAEASGFDGLAVSETSHDPMLGLLLAARQTRSLALMTSVLVALARNPMLIAMQSWELQAASGGRFSLGLGSQVKAHIEHRFGVVWDHPARRMRECIGAIQAIWRSFETGDRPRFRGEFFHHTLLTPEFNPGPHGHSRPEVWLAAVGPRMAQVAGEVADGVIAHPFTTGEYLRQVTIPAVVAGRGRGEFTSDCRIAVSPLVVVSDDPQEQEAGREALRRRVAFYGATESYRAVLELHGWGDVAERLGRTVRRGAWEELAALVPDTVLDAMTIVGTPTHVAALIWRRYGDVAARISLSQDDGPGGSSAGAMIAQVVRHLRERATASEMLGIPVPDGLFN